MRLVAVLEAGRHDFLSAAREVSPDQAGVRPPSSGWSVLECIEHVVLMEDRYLQRMRNGSACAPQRNFDREIRLFTMIRSRLTKLESPEPVRPVGRFHSLSDALEEFCAVRDRTVALTDERGPALYEIGVEHPFFGIVNGPEMIQLIDGHARRHADQIREIAESLGQTQ